MEGEGGLRSPTAYVHSATRDQQSFAPSHGDSGVWGSRSPAFVSSHIQPQPSLARSLFARKVKAPALWGLAGPVWSALSPLSVTTDPAPYLLELPGCVQHATFAPGPLHGHTTSSTPWQHPLTQACQSLPSRIFSNPQTSSP